MSKKKIIIIGSVLLACVLVFGIFWKATEHERFFRSEMKDITQQVEKYRNGERDYFLFMSFLDFVAEDPRMEEHICSLVKEMCENNEDKMLVDFLDEIENADYCNKAVDETLRANFGKTGDLEYILEAVERMNGKLDYYGVSINKNEGFLAEYIKENGTKAFTTEPGKGYYAGMKNESSKHVVGLPTSPLHDSESITYMGDFMCKHSYGVRLNNYYEETPYSNYSYKFRDNGISFGPNDGEIVWSGDYLFCFTKIGVLKDFRKIVE